MPFFKSSHKVVKVAPRVGLRAGSVGDGRLVVGGVISPKQQHALVILAFHCLYLLWLVWFVIF